MTEMVFQIVSATNYNQKVLNIFHKFSRNVVGWESTEYAVTPIEVLFKLQQLSFVTEIYIHPKLYKSVKTMQIFVSDDSFHFEQIAKIYDFNNGIRVQISIKCMYIKMVVLQKQYGKAASIDFLRIYGHEYLKGMEMKTVHSKKKDKINELLIELGMKVKNWDVDETTLITLYDMSKLKEDYIKNGESQNLKKLMKDIQKVIEIGEKIKKNTKQMKYLNARQEYKKMKDISDEIKLLEQRRDHYDEKYQTTRFEEMIALGDETNHHKVLNQMLQEDKKQLERMRLQRERKAEQQKQQIDKQYQKLQKEQWWKQKNQLDEIIHEPPKKKQSKKEVIEKKEEPQKFNFDNPYVYNEGDADMERFLKPFLQEMGGGYFSDPELLRKYEQLDYLDVLGARIWVAAHSQNWRQRAAAVQVVLDFSQSKLPDRYKNGNTRNLFLALMEFARIMAEDKVLQIYYTSLKIMVVALAPPICGEDVPPTLINKSIQKFITIIIDKISQMNSRAKEISKETLVTVFKHKAADINIPINQCLKICKPDLNLKFIPLEKQNPRIILSRLQIIQLILKQFPSKKGVNYQDILNYLIDGSLHHSQLDIREKAIQVLGIIHSLSQHVTIQWYKRQERKFKPAVLHEIQAILHVK